MHLSAPAYERHGVTYAGNEDHYRGRDEKEGGAEEKRNAYVLAYNLFERCRIVAPGASREFPLVRIPFRDNRSSTIG